ncbi:sterol desaturase family protein [Kordiimonas marina]|uniref:sterol desaturase family protein n=1 Tax=Kordiimonas marina TaxID=2872312 RepID=UPI001FF4B315|nr:sterol desaturase family protein [Kordiimonas marina]MCJ9429752.1 sterol desaturase family protein [Kordiimonas marina]
MNEKLVVLCVFLGFVALEVLTGRFPNRGASKKRDWIIEALSMIAITVITIPLVLAAVHTLGDRFFPAAQGMLADLPVPAMVVLLLVGDDMVQYWWHRTSHAVPFLYNLHRAHHSASYMSVRVVYRNNIFYYLFMPSLWISSVLVYMGLGVIYPAYLIIKMAVIIGAHSSVRWDEALIKRPWLSPLLWIVERTISTPSTHFAHHGLHKEDGVTNYKGNYGNLLFFWDVLFGTAHITRRYPKEYGIEGLEPVSWKQEVAWPLAGAGNGVKAASPLPDADTQEA